MRHHNSFDGRPSRSGTTRMFRLLVISFNGIYDQGMDHDISAPYYVRTFLRGSISGLRSSTGRCLGNPGRALGMCKGKFHPRLECRYDCLLNGFIARAENLEDEPPIFAAWLVSKTLSWVGFDMMNGWIDHCETKLSARVACRT